MLYYTLGCMQPLTPVYILPLVWWWWFILGGMDYMSTKVCLIVQGSFTVNTETLPCSEGYDIGNGWST